MDELLEVIGFPTVSQKVGIGKVKFYDPNKQFGFVTSEFGDVFIHGDQCHRLVDNGTETPGLGQPQRTIEGILFNKPKRGDDILFIAEVSTKKGYQAIRWVIWTTEMIDTITTQILNRPVYQLVKTNTDELQIGSSRVLWEGHDLMELKSSYPKHRHPVTESIYFLLDNQKCKDPR
jgi:hypothetical protein